MTERYCKYCKHYSELGLFNCRIKTNENDYKGDKIYILDFCRRKNKNKDCKDYKKDWILFWGK